MEIERIGVTEAEIDVACSEVDPEFLEILRAAIRNVEEFHRQQLRHSHFITRPDGTFLGQIVRPVRRPASTFREDRAARPRSSRSVS